MRVGQTVRYAGRYWRIAKVGANIVELETDYGNARTIAPIHAVTEI